MWEAIESNKRRSWMLIVVMAVVLTGLGTIIAATVDPAAWWIGTASAIALFLVLLFTALIGGDRILLQGVGARLIYSKTEMPKLWNVVEEMTLASGMATMPEIHIIEDSRPNAFATGKSPDRSAVAVTSGLLSRLSRDELQGVVAHEIGHIVNRDIRFMTLAGIMVGSIVLLSEVFLRYMWFSGGGHRGRRTGKGGDARLQIIILIAGILAAMLAPVLARLLYFACSRRREYLADASAARFTRYPEGLATALEKIALGHAGKVARRESSRVLAPMYIVNPLKAYGSSGLFSTHPPTSKRIDVLRAMGGNAHYEAYHSAYQSIFGKGEHCLGPITRTQGREPVEVREPSPEDQAEQPADRLREVTDLLDRIADFVAITCMCGVGIKIPPGFQGEQVLCPRCGKEHAVPKSVVTADADQPLRYVRKTTGWESFRCPACGKSTHLSPAFESPQIRCSGCKRKVQVVAAPEASPVDA